MSHKLRGRWERASRDECATRYPVTLEFRESTYLGAKGPGQGFILWDAGQYDVLDDGRIRIQTASDELVEYRYQLSSQTLTFRDATDCEVQYRRSS